MHTKYYLKCEDNNEEGRGKKCYVTAQSSFEPMVMTKNMLINEIFAIMSLSD